MKCVITTHNTVRIVSVVMRSLLRAMASRQIVKPFLEKVIFGLGLTKYCFFVNRV